MLANRIAVGALWLVGARLATKVLDLVAMLIVARILVPADFGLFALAATVLLVMDAVTDFSLANAIVQMKDPPDAVYDTAFTLNALRGLVLCGALLSIAWPFSTLYGDDRLFWIISVLAIVPVLRGLASPRMAFLQRQLDFRPAFQVEAIGKLAAFCSSVAAALLTGSYWALVAGSVAAPLFSTLLSYRVAQYRPSFALTEWRPIVAFSGWLTLSNTVNTLNWQADRLFIGGGLGPTTLGQYVVGSELASLPMNAPIQPMMQVLYAGFARVSDDLQRLKAAYLTSQCMVMALAVPIAVTVSVFSHSVIRLAIGPDWGSSAYVVQVLAPIFALQMLTGPAQSIAMVRGRTSAIFRRDLVSFSIRLPLILAGLYLAGLEGVVWARVISGLTIIVLNLVLVEDMLGLTLAEQMLAPWRSLTSGLLLATFLLAAGAHLELIDTDDPWRIPELVAVSGAGFALYLAAHTALWSITRPKISAEWKAFHLIRPLLVKYRGG